MNLIEWEAKKFARYADGEVLGYEVARRFEDISDFIGSFRYTGYGTVVSTTFSEGYALKQLRGYQINFHEYDGLHIRERYDLHEIIIDDVIFHDFIDELGRLNANHMLYYGEVKRNEKRKPKKGRRANRKLRA